jgi:hypothetical protein
MKRSRWISVIVVLGLAATGSALAFLWLAPAFYLGPVGCHENNRHRVEQGLAEKILVTGEAGYIGSHM